jgi:hypothetical protein
VLRGYEVPELGRHAAPRNLVRGVVIGWDLCGVEISKRDTGRNDAGRRIEIRRMLTWITVMVLDVRFSRCQTVVYGPEKPSASSVVPFCLLKIDRDYKTSYDRTFVISRSSARGITDAQPDGEALVR